MKYLCLFLIFLLNSFSVTATVPARWLTPDTVLLTFQTPPQTATALFEKNGIHYLFFNQPHIQAPDIPLRADISSFQAQKQSVPVTVFSFHLTPQKQATLTHPTPTTWNLEIGPHKPAFSLVKGHIYPNLLQLTLPQFAPPVWIDLPQLEERALIVPFSENTGGMTQRIDFLRLHLLKSTQGLALIAQTPLAVQQNLNQLSITGSDDLASKHAFFPLLLPPTDADSFTPLRTQLIRFASFTSAADLPLFYQYLGILHLLNGHYQTAADYMRQAPTIHPFWPALNALMQHQPDTARTLLEPINGIAEIDYLKALLAHQKQPIPAFLSKLPTHMQPTLLLMGLQNALTAFDLPLAQTYADAFKNASAPLQNVSILNWVDLWRQFLSGDKTQLPFLTAQTTPDMVAFTAPLWQHLFENAPAYHLTDFETAAVFEELRPIADAFLRPQTKTALAGIYTRLNLPLDAAAFAPEK